MDYLVRYLENQIKNDLEKKMVFISGPRQCGKTTLAKMLVTEIEDKIYPSYMNWDSREDRESIIREQFPRGKGLLVLDEIHKYSRWRQVVKGLYDKRGDELKIIVTGSGRLDYYRYGGDSLQGRYHFYRLHPLTLNELPDKNTTGLMELFKKGPFPEQYLTQNDRDNRRWSLEYRTRIIEEDLDSLENVKDLALVENLVYRLPALVGSPLSINSIRNDLQVSHQTAARWINILENLYMIFRIYPFGSPMIRAVKKEAKHYHFDWNLLDEEGPRFENMTACHLLKWVHYQQDYEGRMYELRYFRDVERREVDFVIMQDNKPTLFIECKRRVKESSTSLRYLKHKFPETRAIQISLLDDDHFISKDGIEVMGAVSFFLELV